jgi:NAD(P)H dehydrogenase (quinone)
MSISIILAHPGTRSFNRAIAERVKVTLEHNLYQVNYHDLCSENFPPLLPEDEIPRDSALPPLIKEHCEEISQAEGIIIIHPNWWGQPPAVLKGWIDRVLRPGTAYEFLENDSGEGVPRGLLKAGAALVFNTSNTLAERELSVFGDPLETIWKNCIFALCGVNSFYRKSFRVIVTSTPVQRQAWLNEVEDITGRYFPPRAPAV